MEYPPIHVMLYADTGVGKSTMARTFPKPMLVFHFDPHGKDWPYRRDEQGNMLPDSGLLSYPINAERSEVEIPYRDVQDPQGIIRLEYYHDEDVDNPFVISTFGYRIAMLHHEYAQWKTIVTDSVTFMELVARNWEMKVMNPMEKFAKGTDTRQWFSGSTDTLEKFLVMRYASLPMNIVICCHIEEKGILRSGELLRGPYAPGRLSKRQELATAYQEQYHLYTARDENGKIVRYVQTENDGEWIATTAIPAPNNCYPHYLSLWENYKG